MNILTTICHEGWQTNLSKTNHKFFSIKSPERPNGWRVNERKLPANWQQIESFNGLKFDCLLINTPQQRQFAAKIRSDFDIPIIEMFHCYPYISWTKADVEEIKKQDIANIKVFATKDCASKWGYDYNREDVKICGHTADEEIFGKVEYTGHIDRVLSVAYDFKERANILGYNEWENIIRGMPHLHIGNEEFATVSTSNWLAEIFYPESRCFINTAKWSPIPTAMVEAMACGCPIICTRAPYNNELFREFSDIVLYEDVFDAKNKIKYLLKNREEACIIGKEIKNLYKSAFSAEKFVSCWENIFEQVFKSCK